MRKSFSVANIRCEGCANSIKKALSPYFGFVDVDLTKEPRIVTVELQNEEDEKKFKEILIGLGYPLYDQDLSTMDKLGLKTKSFVSCAVGKFTLDKGE
ncbi:MULTISPECIES: heavy-metal-associated domain-containing protein [unclassified Nitratiruptor]|uniref:heavy-metal-associated domain-containing protein n=1 Tax=unclassified Nitratiruptor TaxID=2624044 RepID=UPI001916AA56|nr:MULTISPECIES: heavy-metal-associated domain-containing protein [unclassified Nitratiruptor]BCD60440.1 heavy metal transport/detoxification protein [Nitratiruptor sp. YY08-10]BCD64071.1 heavy metal transport/detoxification protein [Nitratiruptor sp. YY08-14]